MIYKVCSSCGSKIPADSTCKCRAKRIREYKSNRLNNKDEKQRQKLYASNKWINKRNDIKCHQFGLDLIEWYKGNDNVDAEEYHHITTIKEDWNRRFENGNIIGLTHKNHKIVHDLMNKSVYEAEKIKKFLYKVLEEFENYFY